MSTVICWSCEKNAGADMFCGSCHALQPPDPTATHFAVLGVKPSFDLDLVELERGYKDRTRQLHPDRFARADARARRASLQRSVQLNDAWKTLRDPVKRGEYLLALAGIDVGTEEGTQRRSADGSKQKLPVPQELLLEIMELREGLLEAHGAGDQRQAAALTSDVRARKQAAMSAVAEALRAEPRRLDEAARHLVAVRYYDRFLDEVDSHQDKQDEQDDQAEAAAAAARAGEVGHAT